VRLLRACEELRRERDAAVDEKDAALQAAEELELERPGRD
jgi:hypothetical protein